MDTAPSVFIHVGFSNTGTTSLQYNFFAKREDIYYVGEPYGECGGIFTTIKNVEDFNLNRAALKRLCDELILNKGGGRPIVISDEALSETPQLYFAPYTMPRDTIALRLHQLFPSPKIIFTIRDQRRYAESMYLNLKRNAAYFDRMPVAAFSDWLAGALSLWRAHYLQNLNFFECISLYAQIFGRENICVMPLEMAITEGASAYLGRLCAFMGLELHETDVTNFEAVRNRRMSVRQALAAELLADERFHRFYADLCEALGPERLTAVLDDGPRCTVAMRPADEEKIRERVEIGNWLLAREFRLDLGGYGYALAKGRELPRRRLALVDQEFSCERDAEPPWMLRSEAAMEVHHSAEVLALRTRLAHMATELETVGRSPVWRTVKRIEGARRILSRAATMVFSIAERGQLNAVAREPSTEITRNSTTMPKALASIMKK